MKPNESLERLSLVLIGVAVGILVGSGVEKNPISPYDILIIELVLIITTAFLRDIAYRKGGN